MLCTGNGNGCKSHGAVTEQGKLAIIRARTTCGARTQAPTLPGESEQEWLTHLEGLRSSLQPANYHEEEIVRNVALAYWQLRRVHLYEVAKARQQMDTESEYGSGGQAMGTLIKAGVESVEAQLAECHRVLELIGLERTAEAAFFLSGDDGRLLLRYAVVVVTKSKLCDESQAFTDLPTEGDPWTWETVRSRLHELAKAAGNLRAMKASAKSGC
jgi:hypothetical protein